MHDDGLQVLSAVEDLDDLGRPLHPEYHVSVSVLTGLAPPHERRTPKDEEMEIVRRDFGMGAADEYNHGPGIVRHLWLDVGADAQEACPCKTDEDDRRGRSRSP